MELMKFRKLLRGACFLCWGLIGCKDQFAEDEIDDMSYPILSRIPIPDKQKQPHEMFEKAQETEQSLDAAQAQDRQQHQQFQAEAKKQQEIQQSLKTLASHAEKETPLADAAYKQERARLHQDLLHEAAQQKQEQILLEQSMTQKP